MGLAGPEKRPRPTLGLPSGSKVLSLDVLELLVWYVRDEWAWPGEVAGEIVVVMECSSLGKSTAVD